jgi:hypothetical protein
VFQIRPNDRFMTTTSKAPKNVTLCNLHVTRRTPLFQSSSETFAHHQSSIRLQRVDAAGWFRPFTENPAAATAGHCDTFPSGG